MAGTAEKSGVADVLFARQPTASAKSRQAPLEASDADQATPEEQRTHGVNDLADLRAAQLQRALCDASSNVDGLGLSPGDNDLLRLLLAAAQRATQRRYADNTSRVDGSYWKFWVQWCSLMGTSPLRSNAAANSGQIPALHAREIALVTGALMCFVADNPTCKIESMMARIRGVVRRHRTLGIKMVSLSLVADTAAGLVQEHIDTHGADSLEPKSKEPFLTVEIIAMLALPDGMRIGGLTAGDNVEWQGVRTCIALAATMGPRSEIFAIGKGEAFGPRKASLFSLTYRFGEEYTKTPTKAQLQGAKAGDMSFITPPPCKNDSDGSKFGATPVPCEYHPDRPINFTREIIRYELMRGAIVAEDNPDRRKREPLILGPGGVSWTKAAWAAFFKEVIARVTNPKRSVKLSFHSFRVWLACALLAAGATPEQIMQLLRWSSETARKLYTRMGIAATTSLLNAAADTSTDSIRSHSLLSMAAKRAAPDVTSLVASQARPTPAAPRPTLLPATSALTDTPSASQDTAQAAGPQRVSTPANPGAASRQGDIPARKAARSKNAQGKEACAAPPPAHAEGTKIPRAPETGLSEGGLRVRGGPAALRLHDTSPADALPVSPPSLFEPPPPHPLPPDATPRDGRLRPSLSAHAEDIETPRHRAPEGGLSEGGLRVRGGPAAMRRALAEGLQRPGGLLDIYIPGHRLDVAELLLAKAVQLMDIASVEQLHDSGTRIDDDDVYEKLHKGRGRIANLASKIDAEDNPALDELDSDSDFE